MTANPAGTAQPGRTEIGVLARLRGRARARRSRAAEGGRPEAVRVRRAPADKHLPRHLGRAAAAARPADRPGRAERQVRRPGPVGLGGRGDPRLHRRGRRRPGRRAGRAARTGPGARSTLPAGRYETLLPPTAVADLLIYLYWSAGAKEAAEGRTVFSKPGGGTRVGERLSSLPVTLSSDPRRRGPASARRSWSRTRPGRTSSVFDNGLPLRPHRLDPRWLAGRPDLDPALGRDRRGAGHPRHRQPDLRWHVRRPGRRRWSR